MVLDLNGRPSMIPWLEVDLPEGSLSTWGRVARRVGRRVCIPAGVVLQRPGLYARKMLYIHSGEVRLTSICGERRKWILVLTGGHLLNDDILLSGHPVLFQAETTKPTDTTILTAAQAVELMDDCPTLAVELVESLATKIGLVLQQVSALTFCDAAERIENLTAFLDRPGLPVGPGDFTHQELADIIGCCRVTVSKAMRRGSGAAGRGRGDLRRLHIS